MEAATTITGEFLIPNGVAAFGMIGGDESADLAEEIVGWIRRHEFTHFTKRDLHRHLRSHVSNPKEWTEPLDLLEANGWIRAVTPPQNKKGRPSEDFEVNPKVLPACHSPAEHGDAWEGPDNG
jgi:hypothetical protein